MPGGKGNIKPEDGVQFGKGNKAAEKWSEADALKLGTDMLNWFKAEEENIFFEDFLFLECDESEYRGVINSDLPSYLSRKFSSFHDLLEKCRKIEEVKLKKYGAFDKLNANIVKFLLSAQHGMSEKKAVDIESPNGTMTPKPSIEFFNAKEIDDEE